MVQPAGFRTAVTWDKLRWNQRNSMVRRAVTTSGIHSGGRFGVTAALVGGCVMRKISNADVRQLQKLAWMKERGILTQDEFAQQKAHLLNSPEETRPPVRLFGSPRLVAWVVGAAAVLTVAVALSV